MLSVQDGQAELHCLSCLVILADLLVACSIRTAKVCLQGWKQGGRMAAASLPKSSLPALPSTSFPWALNLPQTSWRGTRSQIPKPNPPLSTSLFSPGGRMHHQFS